MDRTEEKRIVERWLSLARAELESKTRAASQERHNSEPGSLEREWAAGRYSAFEEALKVLDVDKLDRGLDARG